MPYSKKLLRGGGHTIQVPCGSRIKMLKVSRCTRAVVCFHFFFTRYCDLIKDGLKKVLLFSKEVKMLEL